MFMSGYYELIFCNISTVKDSSSSLSSFLGCFKKSIKESPYEEHHYIHSGYDCAVRKGIDAYDKRLFRQKYHTTKKQINFLILG